MGSGRCILGKGRCLKWTDKGRCLEEVVVVEWLSGGGLEGEEPFRSLYLTVDHPLSSFCLAY